jgi:pSer/pThr/pTyr-binding forkhead associated (FHA) protein
MPCPALHISPSHDARSTTLTHACARARACAQDLGSTNGTFVNGELLESQKYYELLHQDAIRFGNSTREYVLIADDAAGK